MERPTLEALAHRLERVERENRRLKAFGLIAVAVLASVLVMGHTQVPPSISARQLLLMRTDGSMAAVLGVGSDGVPFFAMIPPGQEGSSRIELGVLSDGTAAITARGSGGTGLASMRVSHQGMPYLHMEDATGNTWVLP